MLCITQLRSHLQGQKALGTVGLRSHGRLVGIAASRCCHTCAAVHQQFQGHHIESISSTSSQQSRSLPVWRYQQQSGMKLQTMKNYFLQNERAVQDVLSRDT